MGLITKENEKQLKTENDERRNGVHEKFIT